MKIRIRGFVRNRDGAVALEFGFAIIPLVIVIIGGIEVLLTLFVGSTIETAVQQASRYGITGFATPGVSREDQVREIIEDRTLGLVDMTLIDIETLVYENFANVGQPEPFTDINANGTRESYEPYTDVNGNGQWDADMGVAGLGGPGDVVVYRVNYPWAIMTPIVQTLLGDTITHQSSIAVRNEPF